MLHVPVLVHDRYDDQDTRHRADLDTALHAQTTRTARLVLPEAVDLQEESSSAR